MRMIEQDTITEQINKRKREALRIDAMRAHKTYRHTGLHVTNAEVIVWLEALVRGERVEPPKGHS